MSTMFSDCEVTATRLAELLTLSASEHDATIEQWFAADERPVMRRNYYGRTRAAVDELHRRTQRIEDLRNRVEEWRLDSAAEQAATERDLLNSNARALTQYLDEHGERQMTVLKKQRFEPLVGRVRITVAPHMFVHTDGMPMHLWIDCTEALHEAVLVSKCQVTMWAASAMRQVVGQVEVIHSAARRIVARGVLPPRFEHRVASACDAVHRVWTGRRSSVELRR